MTTLSDRLRNGHEFSQSDCTEAADEIDRLTLELDNCAAALPGPRYMDPPDGGSVTVAEQVRRMTAHVAEIEQERDAARECFAEATDYNRSQELTIAELTQERDALAAAFVALAGHAAGDSQIAAVLAERDARVKAEALREAESVCVNAIDRAVIRGMADAIEKEAGNGD